MRALVAGGAGFIGSHLVRELLAAGYGVEAVDDLSTGRTSNLSDVIHRVDFIAADIVEPYEAWWSGEELDVIIHLASPASPVDYDRLPLATLAVNSAGTWNLLDLAERTGARFVFASTSEVYGDPLVHPQHEGYWGNVDPTGPRSMYDEGKRFGEALVTSYRRVHGVSAAIVRIFNTYGPSMRLTDGRVIPAFINAALRGEPLPIYGDGQQTRSYMYVSDLVDGLLRVALDPSADGLIVNIGNPEEVTVMELAHRVLELTYSELEAEELGYAMLPARVGDPRQRRPDITLMTGRYNWTPKVALGDGLRETVAWAETAR